MAAFQCEDSISDIDDADLDLTDTAVASEDELKEYIKITPSQPAFGDEPIYVQSTDEDEELHELELDSSPVRDNHSEASPEHLNDPPDYESPTEELAETTQKTHDNVTENAGSDDIPYDELLEICGQSTKEESQTNENCDREYFRQIPPSRIKRRYFMSRKSSSVSEQHVGSGGGRGKQPMFGKVRKKSSKIFTSRTVDLVVTDSTAPVLIGEGSEDVPNLDTFPLENDTIPEIPPMICEACHGHEGHNNMVQCCDGHIICKKCVEIHTKKEFSAEKKGFVVCPEPDCNSSVPQSELRKALPSLVLDLLEDSWKKQVVETIENMHDVVKCPSCEFSAVLDEDVKQFQCLTCNVAYCRFCEKRWTERDSHALCIRTKKWTSTVTGNVVNIPAHWTESDYNTEGHVLKELARSSKEFRDVAEYMMEMMIVNISTIYRIQNERLWEKYCLMKSHMVADLGEKDINEKRLFHGTNRDVIQAICKEGFDWRLYGKNGSMYGQGTYFAKSPVVSDRYSSRGGTGRHRFANRLAYQSSKGNFYGHPGLAAQNAAPKYKPPLRFGAPLTAVEGHITMTSTEPPPISLRSQPTASSCLNFLSSSFTSCFGQPNNLSSSFVSCFGPPKNQNPQNPGNTFGFSFPTSLPQISGVTQSSSSGFTGHASGTTAVATTNQAKQPGATVTGFSLHTTGTPSFQRTNQPQSSGVAATTAAKVCETILASKRKSSSSSSPENKGNCQKEGGNNEAKGPCDSDCACIFCVHKMTQGATVPKKAKVPEGLNVSDPAGSGKSNHDMTKGKDSKSSSYENPCRTSDVFLKNLTPGMIPFMQIVTGLPPYTSAGTASGSHNTAQTASSFSSNKSSKNNSSKSHGSQPGNSGSQDSSSINAGSQLGNPGSQSSRIAGSQPGNAVQTTFSFNSNNGSQNNSSRSAGIQSGISGIDFGAIHSNGDSFMFLARVLLGHSCIGTSNMRRPENDRYGRETHSAVDSDHNPSIFVIFDNTQCYPEYLIQYSK